VNADPQSEPARLEVGLGARSYDILVGAGLLADAGTYLSGVLAAPRVVVVTDGNVAPHHLAPLEAALDAAAIQHAAIVLEAGEQTKDFSHLQDLVGKLLGQGVDRGTTLVALGGGVVGDITGFAAAIVLRGIDFVQIPTTLLAQVDSSVGGKTGINAENGKNLVGAFHQPKLVIADTETLNTLAPRELRAGYAEVVKYGLIGDRVFFDWLAENASRILNGDADARRHAVVTSCLAKADVVSEDEHEHGRRALLNLGHTFGHALEAETGFGDELLHGEAVAIGMVLAFELSARLGLCPEADAVAVRGHLQDLGLPVGLGGLKHDAWSAEILLSHMASDKKVRGGKPTFILARGIGAAFSTDDVDTGAVRALLEDALAA